MYQSICVAVDGSEMSHKAVQKGAELASAFCANLFLLHVIRPMKVPQELQRFIKSDDLRKIRSSALEEVAAEIMDKAMEIASRYTVKKVQGTIVKGDPASMVINEAEKNAVDLIIVGTRGLGRVEGAVIGSISQKIANRSHVSMLLVK